MNDSIKLGKTSRQAGRIRLGRMFHQHPIWQQFRPSVYRRSRAQVTRFASPNESAQQSRWSQGKMIQLIKIINSSYCIIKKV